MNKIVVVNGIIPSNINEQTTNTHVTAWTHLKNYFKWKKLYTKGNYIIWFHLYEVQE